MGNMEGVQFREVLTLQATGTESKKIDLVPWMIHTKKSCGFTPPAAAMKSVKVFFFFRYFPSSYLQTKKEIKLGFLSRVQVFEIRCNAMSQYELSTFL